MIKMFITMMMMFVYCCVLFPLPVLLLLECTFLSSLAAFYAQIAVIHCTALVFGLWHPVSVSFPFCVANFELPATFVVGS